MPDKRIRQKKPLHFTVEIHITIRPGPIWWKGSVEVIAVTTVNGKATVGTPVWIGDPNDPNNKPEFDALLKNANDYVATHFPILLAADAEDIAEEALIFGPKVAPLIGASGLTVERTKVATRFINSIERERKGDVRRRLLLPVRGGSRNKKHEWTPKEVRMLQQHYKHLLETWREAKKIVVAAQKSREKTRANHWREAVKASYSYLPDNLIEGGA